jgi:hypothetical protein
MFSQCLPADDPWWDDASMSEKMDENPHGQSQQDGYVGSPTTQQMRTVGQRRRDAEEKLEHHLEEARHKEPHTGHAEPKADGGPVDSADVAAIQKDESLTAADRVDMIANQAVPETDEAGETPESEDGN